MTSSPETSLIGLLGSAGSGRSSFTNAILGKPEATVGYELGSCTTEITQHVHLHESGMEVGLVDTPGFNDSGSQSDLKVLQKIGAFLKNKCDANQKFSGIIFMHSINAPTLDWHTQRRNATLFKKLCRTESVKNVVVVTSFWDGLADVADGVQKESVLQAEDGFLKELYAGGAKFVRWGSFKPGEQPQDPNFFTAKQVVDFLLSLDSVNVEMQEETAKGTVIVDTASGCSLLEDLEQLKRETRVSLETMGKELESIKSSEEVNPRHRQDLDQLRRETRVSLETIGKELKSIKSVEDVNRSRRDELEQFKRETQVTLETMRKELELVRSAEDVNRGHREDFEQLKHETRVSLETIRRELESIRGVGDFNRNYQEELTHGMERMQDRLNGCEKDDEDMRMKLSQWEEYRAQIATKEELDALVSGYQEEFGGLQHEVLKLREANEKLRQIDQQRIEELNQTVVRLRKEREDLAEECKALRSGNHNQFQGFHASLTDITRTYHRETERLQSLLASQGEELKQAKLACAQTQKELDATHQQSQVELKRSEASLKQSQEEALKWKDSYYEQLGVLYNALEGEGNDRFEASQRDEVLHHELQKAHSEKQALQCRNEELERQMREATLTAQKSVAAAEELKVQLQKTLASMPSDTQLHFSQYQAGFEERDGKIANLRQELESLNSQQSMLQPVPAVFPSYSSPVDAAPSRSRNNPASSSQAPHPQQPRRRLWTDDISPVRQHQQQQEPQNLVPVFKAGVDQAQPPRRLSFVETGLPNPRSETIPASQPKRSLVQETRKRLTSFSFINSRGTN
ncbi:hypothetical protein BKA70DRAFT_1559455 [Coprinopsis sp. MPI-PUGE-AT-0042]|nr:hypothetical protein BKA70DRAFT_1559455 [Coprinopsis sp. MPI-PUGE-AT-0042]